MLGSRRRHTSSSRKDDPKLWNTESDSDRPRPATSSSKRPPTDHAAAQSSHVPLDRNHRSSRRPDASGIFSASSASSTHKHSVPRDQSYTATQPYYSAQNHYQAPQPPMAAAGPSTRARTQDLAQDTYDLRDYLKKRTDRRSPRSSEEKLYMTDPGKPSRSNTQQRSGYPSSALPTQAQGLSSTQSYWASQGTAQPVRDPGVSSQSRDKEKEEARERRRIEKEAARARAEEEKTKIRTAERERERERDRRREEKELRRVEREREKERERRREEKEQERLRKYKEKERVREPSRGRDYDQPYSRQTAAAQISAAAGALKQYAESKLGSRYQQPEQIPSSSSNLALPQYGQPLSSTTRLQGTTDTRRDETPALTQITPPHVPEKDRKRHRPPRERPSAQQNAQESGFSSSEQEHSGKERPTSISKRRPPPRDPYDDPHRSGPSGSETERVGRERERTRKLSRTHAEGYNVDQSRGTDPRQYVATTSQGQGAVPSMTQSNVPVGSASFQHYAPPIVSIRAGQGPADPQPPPLYPKSAAISTSNRARDQQHANVPSFSSQNPAGNTSMQAHNIQGGVRQANQQIQDNVSRLHNVLGTSGQAPLPPLPHEVSMQHHQQQAHTQPSSSHGEWVGRSGHTPPSTQLPQPTVTPTSMTQLLPNGYNARQATIAPTEYQQQSKHGIGSSPGKTQGMQFTSDPASHSPARIAKLSVYRAPGLAVSAEVILPTTTTNLPDGSTQTITMTQTTVQDLASRFPLNEDVLTSASSSTLAPGTGQSPLPALPGQSPQLRRRNSGEQFEYPDARLNTSRTTGNPPPEYLSSSNWAMGGASQSKASQRPFHEENDVPIPIIGPRSIPSGPPAVPLHSYQNDLRSQKQTLPPLPGALPPQSSTRPHPTPVQPKASPADGAYGASYTPPRQNMMQAPVPPGLTGTPSLHPSNHSPSRSIQQIAKGSPNSVANGIAPGNVTPKHSPSVRLAGRNGSTDTVYGGPIKSSPNNAAKSIATHPNNNPSQPNVSLRSDTTMQRPTIATSEYPDNARYRFQAPAYPSSAPPQQTAYPPISAPANNVSTYQGPGYHSRSMSQPVVQAPNDAHVQPPRGLTMPVPMSTVPGATPATAPSASAIVSMYRSGLYSSDQAKGQETANQRVPPRSAPSPAPTITGKSYVQPQSSLSKTGFAMPAAAPPPTRGQTQPPPRGAGPPPTTSGTHSRAQSDPQFATQPARVAVSGHPSTPAPPKAQLAYHPSPSEQELLKTPSSLAPSMKSPLPPVRPPTAPAPKSAKERDPSRKKTIFGIFRSRSSPPKPDARAPPEPPKPRQRSASQTTITAVAASVRNIIAPHPNPPQPPRAPAGQTAKAGPLADIAPDPDRGRKMTMLQPTSVPVPPKAPIAAPVPVRPGGHGDSAMSGRRSPGTKMFTPFRLLSHRRHRTVSSASVEALDGTAANTIIGGESARSSTAGRPSPPLRDPWMATQDWRNREEADLRDRGKGRRRRPGVVFDVLEEFTDTETHHPARKLSRGDRR